MRVRSLGSTGLHVSEIGIDASSFGGVPGEQEPSDAIAALQAALEHGINWVEAGEGDGDGRSDRQIAALLARQSAGHGESVCVAARISPASGPSPPSPYCRWEDRYSAAQLRENVHRRLQQLGLERIGLLQLGTWTRAWNDDPQPLLVLRRLREEGKLGLVGVRPPEHDQDCVVQLMRDGLVDVVEIRFNLFHQEPAAQLLPVAAETGTGVIVRDAFDHGALEGQYEPEQTFPEHDPRSGYFAGDRMRRAIERIERVTDDLRRLGIDDRYSLADVALKFVLHPHAVSAVSVAVQNAQQVEKHAAAAGLPELNEPAIAALRRHNWRRA